MSRHQSTVVHCPLSTVHRPPSTTFRQHRGYYQRVKPAFLPVYSELSCLSHKTTVTPVVSAARWLQLNLQVTHSRLDSFPHLREPKGRVRGVRLWRWPVLTGYSCCTRQGWEVRASRGKQCQSFLFFLLTVSRRQWATHWDSFGPSP